jgi:SAM-dependent methyltransferase
MSAQDQQLPGDQHRHWQQTYRAHPGMYGQEPSAPAVHAAEVFHAAGARRVVELGAGHGRDALYLADEGFHVTATDFSTVALAQLDAQAQARELTGMVETLEHDARRALPLSDASADGVFAHMLLCMNLSTSEIRALVDEVRRILRPAGVFVYTVRHTGDAHYDAGIGHGDDIWEHGGFAVHFFPRQLVDQLAEGWGRAEVHGFEEGELPRRLWRITLREPG